MKSVLNERINNIIKLGSLEFTLRRVKLFKLNLRFPWETATPIVLRKEKEVLITDGFTGFKTRVRDIDQIKSLGFIKDKIKIENITFKEVTLDDLNNLDKSRFRIVKIKDIYFSFSSGDSLFSWLDTLKEQSLVKYNLFTGYELYFEEPLFDSLTFRKEVAVKIRIKNRGEVVYIGTLWKKLKVSRRLDRAEKKFYEFLMESGLGSLNSLGFGFMNPV